MADPELNKFLTELGRQRVAPSSPNRRRRKPLSKRLGRLWPLWLAIFGLCVVIGVVLSKSQTPAWQRAVISYIEKSEPVLSIDRVYKPESLQNAVLHDVANQVWWDAGGEYASMAVNPIINLGTDGYCDSSCKFGVRVEYKVDEGFERVGYEDRVFFLKSDYTVTGYAPTNRVRFHGVLTMDTAHKEAVDFLSGKSVE